jgi:hypothetical protein
MKAKVDKMIRNRVMEFLYTKHLSEYACLTKAQWGNNCTLIVSLVKQKFYSWSIYYRMDSGLSTRTQGRKSVIAVYSTKKRAALAYGSESAT